MSKKPDNFNRVVFAGEEAWTLNGERLTEAQRMDEAGSTPEDIWNRTGWFRGRDGRWRWEISDQDSRVTSHHPTNILPTVPDGYELTMRLDQAIHHPQLFDAYPRLRGMPVAFVGFRDENGRPNHDAAAAYQPDEGIIRINTNSRYFNTLLPADGRLRTRALELRLRSSLLHEIQHAIGDSEGFETLWTNQSGPEDEFRVRGQGRPYWLQPWEMEAEEVERRALSGGMRNPPMEARNSTHATREVGAALGTVGRAARGLGSSATAGAVRGVEDSLNQTTVEVSRNYE